MRVFNNERAMLIGLIALVICVASVIAGSVAVKAQIPVEETPTFETPSPFPPTLTPTAAPIRATYPAYRPPVETGDIYEVSWRYERGVVDERIYRDQQTRFIRFRSILPADGSVINDRPASLEEIAFYSGNEQRLALTDQQLISASEIKIPFDAEGNQFPQWLLQRAAEALQAGDTDAVGLYMGIYHYMMADNPTLFLAE